MLRSQKGLPADQETHLRDAIRPPAESPLDASLVGEIDVLAGIELEIQSLFIFLSPLGKTNYELYLEAAVVKAKAGMTPKIVGNQKALKDRRVNHATLPKAGAQGTAQSAEIAQNLAIAPIPAQKIAPNRVPEIIQRTLPSTRRDRSDRQRR